MYHPDAMIQQHNQDKDKPKIKSDSELDDRDFIEIHNTYMMLSDPAAHALYDLSLGNTTSQFNNQRGPFGFSVGFRFSTPNQTRFYPTRRWETDQCWLPELGTDQCWILPHSKMGNQSDWIFFCFFFLTQKKIIIISLNLLWNS